MSLDLIRNVPVLEDPPYVMSGAFWIALAVRANTVARGVQLANQLRREVSRLHISSSGAVECGSAFIFSRIRVQLFFSMRIRIQL